MATTQAIAVQVYRVEYNPVTALNYVSLSYPDSLMVANIQDLLPVNVLGGQDLPGLPWLYCKVVKRTPGLQQEFFVMNSVQDIQNKVNA